jgi:hypothetical protein
MVQLEPDDSIIQKYTVDELDMLHNLVGLGPEWLKSERRAELVAIEKQELLIITDILEDIHIIPKAVSDAQAPSSSDPGAERGR